MTKEIYISSTPHETRLAVVEDDQLAEIYYERENEYTLAGSVYKGKVTRVLPGMQSAFVDIGLERDAFLYVTDFAEEQEDGEEYTSLPQTNGHASSGNDHGRADAPQKRVAETQQEPSSRESSSRDSSNTDTRDNSEPGGRRWRGRRGRRRGRGNQQQRHPSPTSQPEHPASSSTDEPIEFENEAAPHEVEASFESAYPEETAQLLPEARIHSPEIHRQPSAPSHAPTQAETLVLPGESLSKYRRGAAPASAQTEPAAHAATPAPTATVAPSFKPSTMITAPLAWDGSSDVLPGESLSRHKNRPTQTHIDPQPTSSIAAEVAPQEQATSHPEFEPLDKAAAVESVLHEHTLTEHPLTQHPLGHAEVIPAVAHPADFSSQPYSELAEGEVEGPAVSSLPSDPTVSEPIESEPTSASYRVDPAAPSAYRQSSIAEPELEEAPSTAPEPFFNESVPPVQTHPRQGSSPAAEASPAFLDHPAPSQEFAYETEPGDSIEEIEEEFETEPQDAHRFNPGEGNLEEETIDEEETDTFTAHSLLEEDEYDDLIEETLDVQMDSGLLSELVRDQHIDKRTRYSEEPEDGSALEEEDSFEEEASFGDDPNGIELEEIPESFEESEEETESSIADAARPQPHIHRQHRRGVRGQRPGQGGNRGRMRRSTAQTTNLPAITELLKPNQEILVQIAKEPIARKGARITSHIALPGRFLVFMPTVNHVGVSRKISSDEERQRLKHILLSEKGAASGGFIVRTAAASASEEDLRADIRFLLTLWAEIKQRADNSKPPALIYHDLSLVERVLRDQVTDNFSAIWVDSEQDYERVLRFLNRFEPSLVRRVKLYTKETPLFEQFGIQEEINKALRSKVWLKSGGSIVINQTEALVAIDINTGKYVGKTARLEDTILKTNLDAIPEIVRQIRLRDLGGIIVIDFIDMDERKNRNKVMQALEEELKSDRAPSKVLQFNDFGLVAITRKRVKQSLERTLSVPCFICTGTGMVKGPLTVCNEIYIELRKMHRQIDRGDVLLRVHPEVVKQLKASNGRWLSEMEEMSGKTIIVKSDPALHPEQFDIH